MKRILIIVIGLTLGVVSTFAQAERSDVRKGNELFKQGKYPEAETAYKQAIGKNIGSYEAAFNLGDALYKQQRWEEAATAFTKLTEDKRDVTKLSESYYNLGNSHLQMRKFDEAIESYKESLRLNPNDMQSKFNLAYAQKLKQEQEKQDDQNKDKNQDNQQNQDQNQDQNKDKQDDKQDDQNKDNKDKKDDKKDNQQQQQPPQQQPSRQSEQMLKAVQAAEDKTKEKVDKKQAEAVGVQGGKQW